MGKNITELKGKQNEKDYFNQKLFSDLIDCIFYGMLWYPVHREAKPAGSF